MYDIRAEMHLSYNHDVWAYGMVTLEKCMKFPVQVRKYVERETGEEKTFLSFPRRNKNGEWEDVIHPDRELKERILEAVGQAIKGEIQKDLHLPNVEVVSVNPIQPRVPPYAKAYIVGVASVKICGLLIQGITVKQGIKGLFINMPQYKTDSGYQDIIYGTSKAMQEKISAAVIQGYVEVRDKE